MDSQLSSEMIMEIVSRSSLKTLSIMRCISKEINTLTYESYLLGLYMKRNKIVSGFLIQNLRRGFMYIKEFVPSLESHSLDLRFLPYNAGILATAEQGIMVFRIPDPMDVSKVLYHVCKPTTKQVLALPSPPRRENTVVLKLAIVVMGLKPLHYKIISIIEPEHFVVRWWRKYYTTYQCDIFDSMTWEWRSLNRVKLQGGVFLTDPQPITKSGSIYMLLSNNKILKFDAYTEKWKTFPSPIPALEDEYDDTSKPIMVLVKFGGRLGLACKPPNDNCCWEIWVLRMGDQLWEKIYVCKTADVERESLKALYASDTSLMLNHTTLLYYKIKPEGSEMISKIKLNDIPYQIFPLRSDFEPIDLK